MGAANLKAGVSLKPQMQIWKSDAQPWDQIDP
jgi:hypothetical protein